MQSLAYKEGTNIAKGGGGGGGACKDGVEHSVFYIPWVYYTLQVKVPWCSVSMFNFGFKGRWFEPGFCRHVAILD